MNFVVYVRWVLAAHQNLYAKNAKYVENREKYLKSYNFGCNSSTDMI